MSIAYALETLDRPWREQAACTDHPPIYWHPPLDGGLRSPNHEYFPFPKSICRECPVKKDCLHDSKGARGIWGGLDDVERKRLLGKGWLRYDGPPSADHLRILDEYWKGQEAA